MAAFKQRTKHIPLAFIGEAWMDAWLDVRYVTIADSREITRKIAEVGDDDNRSMEEMLAVVQRLFVAGQSVDDAGKLVDLTASDIEAAFDAEAIATIYVRALGNPDPKASATSPTTTPAEAQSQPSA